MTMNKYPIFIDGVSKKYPLYKSNAERLYEVFHPLRRKYHREHWALKNISLKIGKGETVGILGINGSGKSTLLQIICSILQPTSGAVYVEGKIAALIELGAGFNPEMTGRENVEINLTIMGVKKKQIERALEKVEKFSELADFFDQPVKTYSSGMFMRLAFATIVTSDPDILVIDEALAVGDARFQQKCFQKIRDFQEDGKTILFVTHDRFSVPRLCTSAILIHKGILIAQGDPEEVVKKYEKLLFLAEEDAGLALQMEDPLSGRNNFPESILSSLSRVEDKALLNSTYNKNEERYNSGGANIIDYVIQDGHNLNPQTIISGAKIKIIFSVLFNEDVENPLAGYTVKTKDGIIVYSTHSGLLGYQLKPKKAGEVGIYTFEVDLQLCVGDWFIDLAVASSPGKLLDNRRGVIHLCVNTQEARAIGLVDLKTYISEEKEALVA